MTDTDTGASADVNASGAALTGFAADGGRRLRMPVGGLEKLSHRIG
ncbi:hypothetical protein [Streptomyces sp. RB17]|nr:hypothetical protein [Streptomyces sp. RB17]